MKGKPFFIASIVFGIFFVVILGIATVSYMTNSSVVATAINSLLGTTAKSVTNSSIAACSLIFALPSFIFAYKALLDNDTDDDILPEEFEED